MFISSENSLNLLKKAQCINCKYKQYILSEMSHQAMVVLEPLLLRYHTVEYVKEMLR